MTPIELLSPARDLECGMAAIDHGADAIYIGGPSFGARAQAGNPMADIERLVRYSHRFHARVYLTLNTILFDDELKSARDLAFSAWDAGVDALIVQDTGLLELDLPPLPLIASTQMHNVDVSHIRFLEDAGFSRVILARELGLEEIREIREKTSIELEAFVHGSLCVSYSGRCYLSAALGTRSANRGACGQPCRLPWSLMDAKGKTLEQGRHILSLKDMDRSGFIGELLDLGVTAFKIEGRLKDTAYVKNVTAFYRSRIDEALKARPSLLRASSGKSVVVFTPDPSKTFCRGATNYFLTGEADDMWSPDTPKSLGEEIGMVESCGRTWFSLYEGADAINAGDGLCFFDEERELKGMQVVKVVDGHVQTHLPVPDLKPGMRVFRNRDKEFLRVLTGETAERKIGVCLTFSETSSGFTLSCRDEDGVEASVTLACDKEPAEKPEETLETVRKQLSKLGESIFRLDSLKLETAPYFLRISELNALRRDLTKALMDRREASRPRALRSPLKEPPATYPVPNLDYSFNVGNACARDFYLKHGVLTIAKAFELEQPVPPVRVMTTKHCLRRCFNACPRREPGATLDEPLFIEHAGKRFRLAFDCASCRMHVIME